jgi:superfamily II DNA/RNA helicase
MGFIPDIEKICKLLPPRRQTLFFSATMPPEITRLDSQFLRDPERNEVAPPATTAKTITQQFVYCPNSEDWAKRETLRELIRRSTVRNAIIFCNRKVEVAILHRSLVKHGFSAGALHGDMDQKSRTETLDKFRGGDLMLLAASDVAARGLDIPDVSHVFNYDLPWQSDDYVHRIGRTGRAGKEGHSTSLVTTDDLKSLRDIEKMLGEPVVWIGESPSEQDYADAGKKRRRGRGGGAQRGRGRSSAPSSRGSAPQKARGGENRSGEQRQRPERKEEAPAHAEQPRAEAPRREARRPEAPRKEPRQEPRRQDQPRAESRAERQPRHQAEPVRSGQPRPERQPQPQPQRSGFADNVPAFLRNPVRRPAKVAGE